MSAQDRMVYIDSEGPQCIEAKGLVQIPAEFDDVLITLHRDLGTAIDCARIFGGVPRPVAEAVLMNLEPARCAIDLAVNRDRKGTN